MELKVDDLLIFKHRDWTPAIVIAVAEVGAYLMGRDNYRLWVTGQGRATGNNPPGFYFKKFQDLEHDVKEVLPYYA